MVLRAVGVVSDLAGSEWCLATRCVYLVSDLVDYEWRVASICVCGVTHLVILYLECIWMHHRGCGCLSFDLSSVCANASCCSRTDGMKQHYMHSVHDSPDAYEQPT